MFKRFILWLFCRHKEWSAPKLAVLTNLSKHPFRVQCMYCGKTKRIRGETIAGLGIQINKPFYMIKNTKEGIR